MEREIKINGIEYYNNGDIEIEDIELEDGGCGTAYGFLNITKEDKEIDIDIEFEFRIDLNTDSDDGIGDYEYWGERCSDNTHREYISSIQCYALKWYYGKDSKYDFKILESDFGITQEQAKKDIYEAVDKLLSSYYSDIDSELERQYL